MKKYFMFVSLLIACSNSSNAQLIHSYFVGDKQYMLIPAISYSKDSKYFLIGSQGNSDNALKLWDLQSGKIVRTFGEKQPGICSVSFSPDGKYGLAAGKDIFLWDINSGELLRTFTNPTESDIRTVCFSPDGKYILAGGDALLLYNTSSGDLVKTFKGQNSILSACFSPDGKYVIAGSVNHTIKLWGIESGAILKTYNGHSADVSSVCFSPDGKYILSGSYDKRIFLWDIIRCTTIKTFESDGIICSICFSPDGKYILAGGDALVLYNVKTGDLVETFEGQQSILSVCFGRDGKTVLSASSINSVNLWNVPSTLSIRSQK